MLQNIKLNSVCERIISFKSNIINNIIAYDVEGRSCICSYLFCKDIIHFIACCIYGCEKYSHITFIDTTAFPKLIIITKQDWKE